VDIVHTLGFGSSRTTAGLGRIAYVFGGVADLRGLEYGSSLTSGTKCPQSEVHWDPGCGKFLFPRAFPGSCLLALPVGVTIFRERVSDSADYSFMELMGWNCMILPELSGLTGPVCYGATQLRRPAGACALLDMARKPLIILGVVLALLAVAIALAPVVVACSKPTGMAHQRLPQRRGPMGCRRCSRSLPQIPPNLLRRYPPHRRRPPRHKRPKLGDRLWRQRKSSKPSRHLPQSCKPSRPAPAPATKTSPTGVLFRG
jgi:hypothetical protein